MKEVWPRVLIVEDQPVWAKSVLQCEFFEKLHQNAPESIVVVENYEEFKNKLNSYQFDLAITDFMLSEDVSTWHRMARLLKKQQVPVVVVSAYINDVDLLTEMINEYGVVGIFHKGQFDGYTLSNHLNSIIHLENITTNAAIKKIESTPEHKGKTTAPIEIESTPEHKEKVTILHLSDLHYGPEHCFSSKYCNNDLLNDDIPSLSQLIADEIKQMDISVDAMVISGDLSHSGEAEQFDLALETIENLAKNLKISTKQVMIIPGNHDVKRLSDDVKGTKAAFRSFYRNLYECKPKDDQRLFHVSFIGEKNIAIVGLDSCVIEEAETAGIGYIGKVQLDKALNEMRTLAEGHDNYVKVAVLHHHLIPVEEITNIPEQGKNFSLVMDSSIVMRRLYQEDFAIILHGHQHQPYCADIRIHDIERTERTSPIAIIGTGSVGVEKSKTGTIARNHYSIIEIETSADDTEVHVIGRASSTYKKYGFEQFNKITFKLGGGLGILK